MKKLIAIVLTLILAASFAALAEEADLLARIQERGTIVIATEGVWEPWTYHDEDGVLTGLDIEIGKLIAAGLGVEPDFQETAWDSILAGVDSGRFDIACNGVGYTPARAEKYSFSTPYVYTPKVLVVRGDNEDIQTIEDLAGKNTANSSGSTYAQLAEEYGASVTYIDTLGETIQLLEQGRVDATINSRASIQSYLDEHPDADIKIAQELPGDPVAYPVRKDADTDSLIAAVDEILEAARQDGTLAELSIRFLGEDRTQPE